jgi:hypothetical protein
LFEELQKFDNSLTLEDVVSYMEETELNLGDDQGNCLLEFDEFVRLFPERLHRLKLLQDREEAQQATTNELTERLHTVKEAVRHWLKALAEEREVLHQVAYELLGKRGDQYVYDLKDRLRIVTHLLSNPPGPQHDFADLFSDPFGKRKKKKNEAVDVYGYDSFVQEHAREMWWPHLIDDEKAKVRNAIVKSSGGKKDKIDRFAAHDAAQSVLGKLEDVMEWSRHQLEEYESFIEVFELPEQRMPTAMYSHRGLPQLPGEKDEDEYDEANDLGGEDAELKPKGQCAHCLCRC